MLLKVTILLLTLPITGLAFYYKKRLDEGNSMGGAISNPKLFWLFFALSVYFVLNPLFGFFVESAHQKAIQILSCFLIFRAIFQGIAMYSIKKWSPKMGITFNLLGVALTTYWLFNGQNLDNSWQSLLTSPAFLLLIINWFCFAFDTYYACIFYKLEGKNTKGKQPIWYANSEDPKFQQQNKITFLTNTFLSVLFLCFICVL